MKRIIKLTESDLNRIVRRVIKEQDISGKMPDPVQIISCLQDKGLDLSQLPESCTGSFFPPSPPNPTKCKAELESKFKNKIKEISACLGATGNPDVMY